MPAVRAEEITALLGDVDPLLIQRIISTGATIDEVAEALAEVENDLGDGVQRLTTVQSSSPRIAQVKALLELLLEGDSDDLAVIEERIRI